jgi:hypothetical protein
MARASAQLLSEGRWRHAALIDLSLAGARLTGDDLPAAGARATVQLSLAGRAMRLETTVMWLAAGATAAGLAFDAPAPALRRSLAEAMLRAGHHDDADADDGAVVVLINGSPVLGEMSDAIRAHGFALTVSATSEDAIERVERRDPPVRAVIVSGALADGSGEHLLGHLAAEHPDVRRVLMIDAPQEAAQRAGATLAERVLLAPWTTEDLEAVFDLIVDRPIR